MDNSKIKIINLFSPPPYEFYVNEKGERRKIKTNMMSIELLNRNIWNPSLNYNRENVIIVKNIFEMSEEMKAIIKKCSDNGENPLLDTSVVGNLLKKYDAIDNKIILFKEEEKVKPFCKKGCCDCCSHYFYISLVEYFAIKYMLISEGRFDAVREKGIQQYLKLKATNSKEYDLLESKNESLEMFQDHRNLNIFEKCPLLDGNNECSAYAVRPIICRIYGSTGNLSVCDKILKAHKLPFIQKTLQKSVDKYLPTQKIDDDSLSKDISIFAHKDGKRILRPYPLIYWLYHDKAYDKFYKVAICKNKSEFIKSIWG